MLEHHVDLAAALRDAGRLEAAEDAVAAGLEAFPGNLALEEAGTSLRASLAAKDEL